MQAITEDENFRIRKNDMNKLESTDTVSFFIMLKSFEVKMKAKLEAIKKHK